MTTPLSERIHQARSLSHQAWEQPFTPYLCVGSLLAERARVAPDKDFLVYYSDTGRELSYSYSQFDTEVRRLANGMTAELGLQTGDRIATVLFNHPRTVQIYFAAWSLGVTVVPINAGEDDERVAFILANSAVKAAFVFEEYAARVQALRDGGLPALQPVVQAGGKPLAGTLDFAVLLQNELPAALPPVPLDTEALIVYTSGTTGAPKGVVLDHANLLADARSITDWHRFTPDDRAMNVLPIHHVNGIIVTLLTPLYSGGSVVLNRRFRAHGFWNTLHTESCTWCSVVPTVLAFLCEVGSDLSKYDLSRFRHIVCGAGPLTVEMARRFDETFGVRVVHGYGLSETTCYSSFLPIDLDAEAYRHWMFECGFPSIGCPVSANEMAIHDEQGKALPPDTRGEITARGHNVMRGYFQRPEASETAFAHGWFRSGDEGFFRTGSDGRDYYFITGRIKELIIRGGVNYSPFDIDEVLAAIPGIKAAMAVGFENDFYGEEIGAYVQAADGATLTEAEILRACREQLPYAKCPKVVVFGDTFPVTSTGKYQRNKLKPLFAAWRDRQFREKAEDRKQKAEE